MEPLCQVRYKIDELAALVHPRDRHQKIFAMIEAFLDETGIHEGAVSCTIAGYFGGRGQWRKFERLWLQALKDFAVPLEEFHALNFMRQRKFFYGWDNERCAALLARLTEAITNYKIYPVSSSLIIADFLALNEVQRRFFTGATVLGNRLISSGCPNKPYFVPFQRCTKTIASYAEVGGKAHFFFGLGKPFSRYAESLYALIVNGKQPDETRPRLGQISFPLASQTPELQAADLLAYLTGEHLKAYVGSPIPPTPELQALLKNMRMRHDHEIITKDLFEQSVKDILPIAPFLDFDKEEETDVPGIP